MAEDFTNLSQETEQRFSNDAVAKSTANSIASGALLDSYFSGLTFGTSTVAESLAISPEKRKQFLDYERNNPWKTFLASMGGVATGIVGAGLVEGPVAVGQAPSRMGQIANIYRTLAGAKEAKTGVEAAQIWGVSGLAMGVGEVIHQEALDPNFTSEALSKYTGEVLFSGAAGAVLGPAFHGMGEIWNKWQGNKEETIEGVFDTSGNLSAAQSLRLQTNKVFIDDQFKKTVPTLEKLDKGLEISDEEAINLAFWSDIQANKSLYKNAAKELDVAELHNDYVQRHLLQIEHEQFGAGATGAIRNDLTKTVGQKFVDADEKVLASLSPISKSLQEQAEVHFANPTSQGFSTNLAKEVSQKEGTLGQIEDLITNSSKPADLLSRGFETGADGKMRIFDESIEAFELRKQAANDPLHLPNSSYVDSLKKNFDAYREKFFEKKLIPLTIEEEIRAHMGETIERRFERVVRADLNQKDVYDATTLFRQNFENISRKLRKNTDKVVGVSEDALWNGVKGHLSDMIKNKDNFGDFGELAMRKTNLINAMNTVQENLRFDISGNKLLTPAPKPSEGGNFIERSSRRTGEIKTVWNNLGRVSENEDNWRYVASNALGSLDKATNDLFINGITRTDGKGQTGILNELNELFPSREAVQATSYMQNALATAKDAARKINILNNKNIESIFGKGKLYSKEIEGHKGLSTHTRFKMMIRDFAASFVNPAETRYGTLQLFQIGLNKAHDIFGPMVGMETFGSKQMKQVFYDLLNNGKKIQEAQNGLKKAISNVSSQILSMNTISTATRDVAFTYQMKIDEAAHASEINDKFEKIKQNIFKMEQDPSLYADRIHFSLNGVRQYSPQIADATEKKIFEQLGLAKQIYPQILDKTQYKPNISLGAKAKFLDNVDALTDPLKMLNLISDGNITKDQLAIFKTSYPDIWAKTLKQVSDDIFYKSPSPEAKSRAYSIFGIQNHESLYSADDFAMRMVQEQIEAKKPKLPKMAKPKPIGSPGTQLKSFTDKRNLTNPGVVR